MLAAAIVGALLIVLTVLPTFLVALLDAGPRGAAECACGYDLTGLPSEGTCPECAAAFTGNLPGRASRSRRPRAAAVVLPLVPPLVAAAGATVIWAVARPPITPEELLAAAVTPPALHASLLAVAALGSTPRGFAALVLLTPVPPLLVMFAAFSGLCTGPASDDYMWPLSDLVLGVGGYLVAGVVSWLVAWVLVRASARRRGSVSRA